MVEQELRHAVRPNDRNAVLYRRVYRAVCRNDHRQHGTISARAQRRDVLCQHRASRAECFHSVSSNSAPLQKA